MKFKYRAIKNGNTYENTVELADRFSVYRQVRKEGGEIISIEKIDRNVSGTMKRLNNMFGTVKTSDKIILARNLAVMVKSGIPLSRAILIISRQSKNKKLKEILTKIEFNIKKGSSFHEALGKFPKVFSSLFVSMVKAGEESGNLVGSLSAISVQVERANNLKKKIKGALIYPAIIISAMVIIGIIMLLYVVPTLTKTFNELNIELPRSTQFIISLSEFLTSSTLSALFIGAIVIILAILGLRSERGKKFSNFMVLKIPIISGLAKETNSARTARTLSSLLSSGVEVVNALSITRDVVQNRYYKKILAQARDEIQRGGSLSKIFIENEKLYPLLVGEMIAVGEETGKLADMLRQVADFYEDEVEQKTKNMSTIIEPFLMVFIGVVVGFFAISMISPIYSISSGI